MKDMLPQDNSLTTRINKIKVIIGFQPISEQHSTLCYTSILLNTTHMCMPVAVKQVKIAQEVS